LELGYQAVGRYGADNGRTMACSIAVAYSFER